VLTLWQAKGGRFLDTMELLYTLSQQTQEISYVQEIQNGKQAQ